MRTRMTGLMAIAALTMALGMGTQARAVDLTFNLTSGIGTINSNFSKTVSDYTLTFSNPSSSPVFYGSSDGLLIGRHITSSVTGTRSFDIQLTGGQPGDYLIFKSYEVSSIFGSGANPFSLTGGTGTSTDNSLASSGVFNFNGPFSIAQGQTVSFLAPYNNIGGNLSRIKSITLTVVPVPEPSTYAMGGIGTLTMAWLARRRKAKGKG